MGFVLNLQRMSAVGGGSAPAAISSTSFHDCSSASTNCGNSSLSVTLCHC